MDGESFEDIESRGLAEWLNGLGKELHDKTYQPQPVRRVLIPKPGGGERPLGIPTIRDRVVQTAAKLVIEPIFEADLEPSAYGYRPRKSAQDAVQKVDENRMADNKKIAASFEELKKMVLERSAPTAKPKSNDSDPRSPRKVEGNEKGYKYTIRSGDVLSRIVTQLNKQGVKVTQKQVMEANPGVKWERLRIGDELFIPAPGAL